MLFYVLIDKWRRVHFSPVPKVDKHYLGSFKLLNVGIPLEALERYLEGINLSSDQNNAAQGVIELEKYIAARIVKGLSKDGSTIEKKQIQDGWVYLQEEYSEKLPDDRCFNSFRKLMEGRLTAESELPLIGQKLNIDVESVIGLMQKAVLEKTGRFMPAVRRRGFDWHCLRCGGDKYELWPSLYGTAATCQGCKSVGALNSMQVMFYLEKGDKFINKTEEILEKNELCTEEFSFEYTPAQKNAALTLNVYSLSNDYKGILVWAACGAGKTEICFPLIKRYLKEGKNVLFAAPRQDVVHDVYPRLQRDFREYRIRALSGALPKDLENAPLTVATTHQVLRFFQAFDLIIFDEMDAYPYKDNKVLAYGLNRALKKNGLIVYLTATPSQEILKKSERGECSIIRLPARYHGAPLPVPEIAAVKLPLLTGKHKDELSQDIKQELKKILDGLLQQGLLLVFVPTVLLVEKWVEILRAMFQDRVVGGSWSSDPERRKKVSDLMNSSYDIFVSTSILERGITINRVQAVILYADHELYDVRTLVQMAGRPGRTLECPSGRALFIASKVTKPMILATSWIEEQNTLARKEGYLNE